MTFTTKNGVIITVTPETMSHMQAHSEVNFDLIKEAISRLEYDGGYVWTAVQMPIIVGKNRCVTLRDGEAPVMLRRKNRAGLTPCFIGTERAENTNLITIGIQEGKLITAFYGPAAPLEPWDPALKTEEEKAKSTQFWATHAICMDPEQIDWENTPIKK